MLSPKKNTLRFMVLSHNSPVWSQYERPRRADLGNSRPLSCFFRVSLGPWRGRGLSSVWCAQAGAPGPAEAAAESCSHVLRPPTGAHSLRPGDAGWRSCCALRGLGGRRHSLCTLKLSTKARVDPESGESGARGGRVELRSTDLSSPPRPPSPNAPRRAGAQEV